MTLGRALSSVAFLALAFAVVGCGGSSGTAPSEGTGAAGNGNRIEVDASEYAFDPATLSVPAGPITFAVRNVGTVEHEFEIFRGDQVVDEVEGLVPGLTRELTVTLDAGGYTYVCKLAGHEEAGMTGSLTVTD